MKEENEEDCQGPLVQPCLYATSCKAHLNWAEFKRQCLEKTEEEGDVPDWLKTIQSEQSTDKPDPPRADDPNADFSHVPRSLVPGAASRAIKPQPRRQPQTVVAAPFNSCHGRAPTRPSMHTDPTRGHREVRVHGSPGRAR